MNSIVHILLFQGRCWANNGSGQYRDTPTSEAAQRVNEGFVSLISQIPGFVAYYLVDVGGGVAISTSVFQDQASAEESNRRAADYRLQNLVSVLPNPPQITAGEVVAYKAQ